MRGNRRYASSSIAHMVIFDFRYAALDATMMFSNIPLFLQTMSFHCGGNFTFETDSGYGHGFESADIRDGNPNCLVSSELNNKLAIAMEKGVEEWSIIPDLTSHKPTKIDFMEMLKEQAKSSHDKTLSDAVDFVSQYKDSHSHFIILGAKFTLSNLLKEMNTKPRIPSKKLA